MHEATVHEHVRDELPQVEIIGKKEMEAQNIVQVDTHSSHDNGDDEHQHVDDQQVFCYNWYVAHNSIKFRSVYKITNFSRYNA